MSGYKVPLSQSTRCVHHRSRSYIKIAMRESMILFQGTRGRELFPVTSTHWRGGSARFRRGAVRVHTFFNCHTEYPYQSVTTYNTNMGKDRPSIRRFVS